MNTLVHPPLLQTIQVTLFILHEHIDSSPIITDYANNPSRIKVITKLPNSEQSYKGKVKTHNYINRQNQSTTGKL